MHRKKEQTPRLRESQVVPDGCLLLRMEWDSSVISITSNKRLLFIKAIIKQSQKANVTPSNPAFPNQRSKKKKFA